MTTAVVTHIGRVEGVYAYPAMFAICSCGWRSADYSASVPGDPELALFESRKIAEDALAWHYKLEEIA